MNQPNIEKQWDNIYLLHNQGLFGESSTKYTKEELALLYIEIHKIISE